jgi:hypothetical protein
MFRNISKVLNRIAMEKYIIIGAIEVLSAPETAKIITLMRVINNPDRPSPTVYRDTTSFER